MLHSEKYGKSSIPYALQAPRSHRVSRPSGYEDSPLLPSQRKRAARGVPEKATMRLQLVGVIQAWFLRRCLALKKNYAHASSVSALGIKGLGESRANVKIERKYESCGNSRAIIPQEPPLQGSDRSDQVLVEFAFAGYPKVSLRQGRSTYGLRYLSGLLSCAMELWDSVPLPP